MATATREITLESKDHQRQAGGRRKIRRVVRNLSAELEPQARGWMGTKYWQWTGEIILQGRLIKVWGYRRQLGGWEQDRMPPTAWADDSY